MKRTALVIAVAAAVAASVLAPVLLLADTASCSVEVTSYADSVLNPPSGEDAEFFVTSGGIPTIVFLISNSSSMIRLPPNGASLTWGSFGSGYGCSNGFARALTFHSSCGTTTADDLPYDGGVDFAEAKDVAGHYCPYLNTGSGSSPKPANDKAGYDPDYYGSSGSKPVYFKNSKVYHDAVGGLASDGWSTLGTNPTTHATPTDFCNQYGDATKASACTTCMKGSGYFFDGTYAAATMACGSTEDCVKHAAGTCIADGTGLEYDLGVAGVAHCRAPNVWFSGNFLNFQPPKFVIARKVLKDLVLDTRRIRLAAADFAVTKSGVADGANKVRDLNPQCNLLTSDTSGFDSNRSTFPSAIDAITFDSPGAQYAEALMDIGNLFLSHTRDWFNTTYQRKGWQETGGAGGTTNNSATVCYSCQATAVVILGDGLPVRDGVVPGPSYAPKPMTTTRSDEAGSYAGQSDYNITGIGGSDCSVCEETRNGGVNPEAADPSISAGECVGQQASGACDDSSNPIAAYLPKVAWYLQHMDFRPDTEKGFDDFPYEKKQSLTTYTLGLGTRLQYNAAKLLLDTAEAGGGLYNGGSGSDVMDAKGLRDAIKKIFEDVDTRSTSFGAASMSTLQVASTQGVLVPRFEPARSAHWDGHLYAYDLYSEFASGTCTPADPKTSGPKNGDYDCDGKCQSVFLKDADGAFIQEDSTGAFVKNATPGLAPCTGSCASTNCSGPSTDPVNGPAKPFWDAGKKLAAAVKKVKADGTTEWVSNTGYVAWNERNIYTVTDDASPRGRFTSSDTRVKLGDSSGEALAPYLNIKGTKFCSNLAARLESRGDTTRAKKINDELVTSTYTQCAQVVVDFVRGADVFNDGPLPCSAYPRTYCTRKYQLGDIFHSSPVEVWAPLASDGWACPRGLHPQCLPSLFSGSIPNPSSTTPRNANAYDDYAKSDHYKKRKKFVLVGANDGMLHAFRIDRGDTRAGEEIWGFIPPDLLPKLKLLMESAHQFYVDATPMVRDVWMEDIDGNNLASANVNGTREKGEFHTVAVVGERRGGTHYFALDVTDASDNYDAAPKFMWLYPQPDDPESLSFGETYVEFLPKPPPIGPVRIDEGPSGGGCAPRYGTYQDGAGETRCFEERWIAFLSGGFDPTYTKGRGVHMVDLATGDEIWDFSQPPGPASDCDSQDDPRCFLNFPVAATVGMMMWGKEAEFLSAAAVDGYFDTATFGDTGGQLWVVRFNDPGKRDANDKNRVSNWYGARVFQTGLVATTPKCDYCGGQPFFYITSNLPLAANGLYRTLDGTGDRFNILDPAGGVCGPDNIRACLLKGCTVKLQDASGNPGAVYGVDSLLGTQKYGMNHPAECSGFDPATYTYSQSTGGGAACSTVVTKIDKLVITCPGAVTCSTHDETTTKRASVSCTDEHCEPGSGNDQGWQLDLKGNKDKENWFYSIQVFERTGDRVIFRDLVGARKYDAARLTESALTDLNKFDASGSVSDLATPEGKGWRYYFDHGAPSTPDTVTVAGAQRHINRTDERVTSPSTVEYGCAFWNTLQATTPLGAYQANTLCPANTPCKAGKKQVSYVYAANAGTGAMCLTTPAGASMRSTMHETLAPPTIGKMVAYVGQGQVAFGLSSVQVQQGGANLQLGEAQDLVSPVEWLPVDRATHECRHSPKATAPENKVCR